MASTSASVSEAKKELREQIKSQLSQLSSAEIERQSKEVTSQVCKLPAFEHARRISIYLSMPKGEISTTDIVKQALEQGKKVFVPHIQKSQESTSSEKTMEMLALSSLEDLESLEHDSWGIPKLSKASVPERQNALGGFGRSKDTSSEEADHAAGLDLILLPGMAFDSSNGRLGHGKGFYDHFLQKYWEMASRRSIPPKMPFLVGLSLKEQLLPPDCSVPMTTNDWRVDRVISGS